VGGTDRTREPAGSARRSNGIRRGALLDFSVLLKRWPLHLVLLTVAVWSLSSCAPQRAGELCLTQLDVGQGDSLLLEFPRGEVWLVDGGGFAGGDGLVGRRSVLPELRRRGIARIDRLIISHADSDHYEGLFALPGHVEVSEVWLPSRAAGPRFRRLLTLLRRGGARLIVLEENAVPFTAPSLVKARLLHPSDEWRRKGGAQAGKNNNSLVFSLSLGHVDFLLTGDLEEEGEDWLLEHGVVDESEVLKLGHHGSKSSSSEAFMKAVSPLVSLAGVGRENRFGFPHASVRRRVLMGGSAMFWSARHGVVRTCTDGWGLRVEQLLSGKVSAQLGAWDPRELLKRKSGGFGRKLGSEEHPETQAPRSKRRSAVQGLAPTRQRLPRSAGISGVKERSGKGTKTRRPAEDPPPLSPSLIDERTWQRRRRGRNRFRPGW